MNTQSRENIHKCTEFLEHAEKALHVAANTVENQIIRNQITNQVNSICKCVEECEKISSDLSQHLNEKNYEGIHH